MHTMFIWKPPVVDEDIFFACQSAADTLTGFKDKGLKSALSQVKRGCEACYSPADDKRVIVFIHWLIIFDPLIRMKPISFQTRLFICQATERYKTLSASINTRHNSDGDSYEPSRHLHKTIRSRPGGNAGNPRIRTG